MCVLCELPIPQAEAIVRVVSDDSAVSLEVAESLMIVRQDGVVQHVGRDQEILLVVDPEVQEGDEAFQGVDGTYVIVDLHVHGVGVTSVPVKLAYGMPQYPRVDDSALGGSDQLDPVIRVFGGLVVVHPGQVCLVERVHPELDSVDHCIVVFRGEELQQDLHVSPATRRNAHHNPAIAVHCVCV